MAGLVALTGVGAGCADAAGPVAAADIELLLENLPALEPAQGRYHAWVIEADGDIHAAGFFDPVSGSPVTLSSPIAEPTDLMVTIEPSGGPGRLPSPLTLIGGRFVGGSAELDVNRYVTAGIPLEDRPGTHVLFTPSDNAEVGYPSNEDAGIWLFNIRGDTLDGTFYLTLTPLTKGWIYEGWAVRDYGTSAAVWLSYGKFEPDPFRKVRSRDDTGLGPFSGQLDYRYAMPDEIVMPGDDWVSNPHGYPVPGGLDLPIDLNGGNGEPSRWTHVISIEPKAEEDEDPWLAEPFGVLEPYRNAFGEGPPEEARTVEYHGEGLPRGTATIRPRPPSEGG